MINFPLVNFEQGLLMTLDLGPHDAKAWSLAMTEDIENTTPDREVRLG